MPIYEYRCESCGGEFERYVATNSTSVVCDRCGSDRLARKISLSRRRNDDVFPPFKTPASGDCGGCSHR
jgi:putative FmdB family regulatory protein